jgi:hypothetical protein
MSDPPENNGRMKKRRFTLEPELEEETALLTAAQRMRLARKFERWARQLRVSAFILRQDAHPGPRPSLRAVPRRRLVLN